MINLLPAKAQRMFRYERFTRFMVVTGALILLLLFLGGVLLTVPWVTLDLEERELAKQRAALSKSPSLIRAEALESDIRILNATLRSFKKNRESVIFPSRVFDRVLALSYARPDISLSAMAYDAPRSPDAHPQFRIEGHAANRSALIGLSNALTDDPFIENVRSPISNLLREEDVEFILTFESSLLLLQGEELHEKNN